MNPHILVGVAEATKDLSTIELCAIFNVSSVGWDASHLAGYDKVKHLFTEKGGTALHAEALTALSLIVDERIQSEAPGASPN